MKEKLAEAFLEYGNVLNGMFFISVSISRCEECSIMSPAEKGRIIDPVLYSELAGESSYRSICLNHIKKILVFLLSIQEIIFLKYLQHGWPPSLLLKSSTIFLRSASFKPFNCFCTYNVK
ncbi:hypothetical protein S245_013340 [Arachis hypogaea]